MSFIDGIKSHYRMLGAPGVLIAAKCRLSGKPREILVSADGLAHPVKLRMRTTDLSVFEEIIQNEEYALDLATPPNVIVDAGANIGLTSVYFANVFPDARIIAVEPEASNFRMLEVNAAPYSNITPVRAALWKDSITLELTNPNDGNWGFRTQETSGDRSNDTSVPGITVEELMSSCGVGFIDLLKVDIEGAEKEVFEHSSTWIDRVGTIVVELHDRLKAGCSQSVFSAARDFPVTWQKGETTFMLRTPRAVNSSEATKFLARNRRSSGRARIVEG